MDMLTLTFNAGGFLPVSHTGFYVVDVADQTIRDGIGKRKTANSCFVGMKETLLLHTSNVIITSVKASGNIWLVYYYAYNPVEVESLPSDLLTRLVIDDF